MKTPVQLIGVHPLSISSEIYPDADFQDNTIYEKMEITSSDINISTQNFQLSIDVTGIYTAKNRNDELISKVAGTYRLFFLVKKEFENYDIDLSSKYLDNNPVILNAVAAIQNMFVSQAVFSEMKKMGLKSSLPLAEITVETEEPE